MSEWIRVGDKLPQPKERVIFASTEKGICVGYKESADTDSLWWSDELDLKTWDRDPDDVWDVTHWMPLPDPPVQP